MPRRVEALTSFFVALAVTFGHLPAASGEQRSKVSVKQYRKQREQSSSREAFERARLRVAGVRLGMRADEFFAQMGMMVLRGKKGRGIDGFCDGHLPFESLELSRGREPERVMVFGWYENPKASKGAVRKFYAVFRENVLTELFWFDPEDGDAPPSAALR